MTIDELVSKAGTSVKSFATLSTDDFFARTSTMDKYNSSLMDRTQYFYETLNRYYSNIMNFLLRFDHYLEMLVWNAELVQQVVSGHLIDYSHHF